MSAEVDPTVRDYAKALLQEPERGRLLGYARSRFGIGTQDSEDLLQETALELLRQRHYVQNPRGFVFAVFRGRCTRWVQARRIRREILAGGTELCEAVAHPAATENADRQLSLRQAFGEISFPCQRLLCAYYIEGRSLREAAEAMSLAYSGVAKTINRCLKRLRACLS